MWDRLKLFFTPFDARFEDMTRTNWRSVVWRDTSAAIIVAMMAIPMAMGFAISAGLRPEHGILAGAIAGVVGGLFGGSKYNTYGPVAALIPVVAGLMAAHATPDNPYAGHGFLVLICIGSGLILMLVGLLGWGKFGNLVPHSIVVGFSVGIAVVIGLTQLDEMLGLEEDAHGSFLNMLRIIWNNLHKLNWAAVFLAGLTFVITRSLLKVSIYIPAPLIAIGVTTLLSATLLSDAGLILIKTKYGAIPTDFLMVSAPALPSRDWATLGELVFYSLAFAFVCGFESVLCARMADRMAENRGTPYDPDKEFWGQGLIQMFVPLLHGMPLSGALARTSTKVQVGGMTPLAEILKSVFKLLLVYFLARYLELIPMACIGGILLWVAVNMVKPVEIKKVWNINGFHAFLMIYTAATVIIFGFLFGVVSAMVVWGVLFKFLDTPAAGSGQASELPPTISLVEENAPTAQDVLLPTGQSLAEAK